MNPSSRPSCRSAVLVALSAAALLGGVVSPAAAVSAPAAPQSPPPLITPTNVPAPSLGGSLEDAARPALPPRTAAPRIVGGEIAMDRSIVQLAFTRGGDSYRCTGEAIGAEWVLTAKHCVEGIESMNVYHSNDTRDPGKPIAADRVHLAPSGDVALVHLSQRRYLGSYPELDGAYTPQAGDAGEIYGYGLRAFKREADHLRTASVSVLGESRDAYGGRAVHIRGGSGASNHGDSGGPLVINGKIVAICSTGDSADPGGDIHAGSNYANLNESIGWIRQVTGIK